MKVYISLIFLFLLSGRALQSEAAVPVFSLAEGIGVKALTGN